MKNRPYFARVAADPRADGALRNVSITGRRVEIARRVAGISMRIRIATSAYRGVALSVAAARAGGTCYRVSLVHRDPDLDVELYAALHDRDVFTEWQRWAAYFVLPRLVERGLRRFETIAREFGSIAVAAPKPRRRGAILSKRRPRMRLKRHVPAPRPIRILPSEAEITSYE